MENGNTNWGQSVTGVVIKDGKVLLVMQIRFDYVGLREDCYVYGGQDD